MRNIDVRGSTLTLTLCRGRCQLAAETAARDAQEEADRRAMAAEETARKKAAAADRKGKGGKELSPTPKKSKAKETSSSSPVPAGRMTTVTIIMEFKQHSSSK